MDKLYQNIKINFIKKHGIEDDKFNKLLIEVIENIVNSRFKLISWNIYFKIYKENRVNKISRIEDYLYSQKPDILFTQETALTLKKPYQSINFDNGKTAISINFNKNKFDFIEKNELVLSNSVKLNPLGSRPMLGVRLKNKITNETIVFLNLHAPHSFKEPSKSMMIKYFENFMTECILPIFKSGDRIIIAGDFNEYYREFKKEQINVMGKTLFLKQRNPSCCGIDNVNLRDLFQDGFDGNPSIFDLIYDTNQNDGIITVDTNMKTSDHYPIIGNFNQSLRHKYGDNQSLRYKNVGYDFDGVLHRTMRNYEPKKIGTKTLYQGHPNWLIETEKYKSNQNIINDMKKHISEGSNVYIISRNPDPKKLLFLQKNSTTLYNYFNQRQRQIIVANRGQSKADLIRSLNITKFVEDSTIELDNIKQKLPDVDLYLVETYKIYKIKDLVTEPSMIIY
jgi:exonuclease III